MAQFDVHENPSPHDREAIPYLLDIQADLLNALPTRVVVPLIRREAFGRPLERMAPVFEVNGEALVMGTALLAGVGKDSLGPKAGSLASRRHDILNALDMLVSGV